MSYNDTIKYLKQQVYWMDDFPSFDDLSYKYLIFYRKSYNKKSGKYEWKELNENRKIKDLLPSKTFTLELKYDILYYPSLFKCLEPSSD